MLRIAVEGGGKFDLLYIYIALFIFNLVGCSGYKYTFKFDEKINEDD